MGLFGQQRRDGDFVKNISPYTRIFPFLMRGRNESAVYYPLSVDVSEALSYLEEKKEQGVHIGFFPLVIAAMARTAAERPLINRFISGRRMYMRRVFDVAYAVKREFTDDAEDKIARVALPPESTVFTIAELINGSSKSLKSGGDSKEDWLLNAFASLPKPMLSFIVAMVRWMDNHRCLPASFADGLPMFASVFTANLGSIGAEAPFHHLYEFGTTSIFMTLGKIHPEPLVMEDGSIASRPVAKFGFTVDERICDGFYLIRSIKIFEDYLKNPRLLETPHEPKQGK